MVLDDYTCVEPPEGLDPTPAALTDKASQSRVLSETFPAVAAEWHGTRNADLTPASVAPASKLKAWWRCGRCGNEWQATVGSRTRGHGCPSCARRTSALARSRPALGKSLMELFPEIAADWHPSRNVALRPEDIGYASNKKVWWLCSTCGNEWLIQVCNRTRGSGCRKCAMATRRTPKVGESLANRRPGVAREWHPTRNDDLSASDVKPVSHYRAWWLCNDCGHEWQASVDNRTAGSGCPVCARSARVRSRSKQKPKGRNATNSSPVKADKQSRPFISFAKRFPDIAAEWHPSRNGDLAPDSVRYACNDRAWWLCSTCQHEWSAVINSRGRGSGCPCCARQRTGRKNAKPKPGQSLAERFPELAAQWHPYRNQDLTPDSVSAMSGRAIWWLCGMCAHEWQAPVYSRANGYGCKPCATARAAEKYSKPKKDSSLAERRPALAAQWHPTRNGDLVPTEVTATSGKRVWWKCEYGHEWPAFINNRVKAPGCPKCILWGTSVEEIRLRHELIAAGVPVDEIGEIRHTSGKILRGDIVSSAWNTVIEFDGYRFHSLPLSREKDERKSLLLAESGWTVIRVRENLTPIGDHDVVVPLLSDELTRAKAVLKRLRELGHVPSEYSKYMKASLPQGSLGADAEAKRRMAKSLATDAPSVAAEWDVVRNEGLTPQDVTSGSGSKVWWLCSKCGFNWQAAVGSRARNGHGCPDCGRRASVKSLRAQSGRSLAERFPHLIAEWHPMRNGDLTPDTVRCASHRTVWWSGPCGHEWEAPIKSRTLGKARCPKCRKAASVSGARDH
jgi:predicted metal-binding protein